MDSRKKEVIYQTPATGVDILGRFGVVLDLREVGVRRCEVLLWNENKRWPTLLKIAPKKPTIDDGHKASKNDSRQSKD